MRSQVFCCFTLLAACTHVGRGEGELVPTSVAAGAESTPQGKIAFDWRSGFDTSEGQLHATLANGNVFAGKYMQIRAQMDTNTFGPYFVGWNTPEWASDPWYGGNPKQFSRANTGKVVALLNNANGKQMRCKLQLDKPDSGLSGGGAGQCQFADRTAVFDAKFK